ncbi:hypothetical protein ACIO13_04580 [Streptomyces sp. NPDC087425]|uniref:hypothetical protein n=1 Tax=Streptomyces sp. NPDC087425 TaxID=3365787 RepID=UPI0038037967
MNAPEEPPAVQEPAETIGLAPKSPPAPEPKEPPTSRPPVAESAICRTASAALPPRQTAESTVEPEPSLAAVSVLDVRSSGYGTTVVKQLG